MEVKKLQKLIESARAPYTPGVPMDAATDQAILVGLIDGLGGGTASEFDSAPKQAGTRIGRSIRRALA
jgi:serine/threonine protein phosphatase PrpC